MRKKVLTAGLLATMLALNVTACGNKTAPKEVQTAAETDSETNGTDGTATTEETKDAESQETEAETVAQNIPDESRYELQSREPASNAVNTITVTKNGKSETLKVSYNPYELGFNGKTINLREYIGTGAIKTLIEDLAYFDPNLKIQDQYTYRISDHDNRECDYEYGWNIYRTEVPENINHDYIEVDGEDRTISPFYIYMDNVFDHSRPYGCLTVSVTPAGAHISFSGRSTSLYTIGGVPISEFAYGRPIKQMCSNYSDGQSGSSSDKNTVYSYKGTMNDAEAWGLPKWSEKKNAHHLYPESAVCDALYITARRDSSDNLRVEYDLYLANIGDGLADMEGNMLETLHRWEAEGRSENYTIDRETMARQYPTTKALQVTYNGQSADFSKYFNSTDTKSLVQDFIKMTNPDDKFRTHGYRTSDLNPRELYKFENEMQWHGERGDTDENTVDFADGRTWKYVFQAEGDDGALKMYPNQNLMRINLDADDDWSLGGYSKADFANDYAGCMKNLFGDCMINGIGFIGSKEAADKFIDTTGAEGADNNEAYAIVVVSQNNADEQLVSATIQLYLPTISKDLSNVSGNARETFDSWFGDRLYKE